MKSDVEIRLVQFDPAWLDPAANAAHAVAAIDAVAAAGADLIVFPELSNLGYVTPASSEGDAEYPPGVGDAEAFRRRYEAGAAGAPTFLEAIAQATARHDCTVVVGIARRSEDGSLRNSCAVVGPSGTIGIQDKLHMPPQEMPFFTAGAVTPKSAPSAASGPRSATTAASRRSAVCRRSAAPKSASSSTPAAATCNAPGASKGRSRTARTFAARRTASTTRSAIASGPKGRPGSPGAA